jgi:hypothetical protein
MSEDFEPDRRFLLTEQGARPMRPPVTAGVERLLRIALVIAMAAALVIALAGVPNLIGGDDGPGGPVRKLGRVALQPVPGDLPRIVAQIGEPARVQLTILREIGPQEYRPVITRRLGEVEAGTRTLELGSGHASDGTAPGEVLDTSRLLPFEVVPGEEGGLEPGRYAASVQMRSLD